MKVVILNSSLCTDNDKHLYILQPWDRAVTFYTSSLYLHNAWNILICIELTYIAIDEEYRNIIIDIVLFTRPTTHWGTSTL